MRCVLVIAGWALILLTPQPRFELLKLLGVVIVGYYAGRGAAAGDAA